MEGTSEPPNCKETDHFDPSSPPHEGAEPEEHDLPSETQAQQTEGAEEEGSPRPLPSEEAPPQEPTAATANTSPPTLELLQRQLKELVRGELAKRGLDRGATEAGAPVNFGERLKDLPESILLPTLEDFPTFLRRFADFKANGEEPVSEQEQPEQTVVPFQGTDLFFKKRGTDVERLRSDPDRPFTALILCENSVEKRTEFSQKFSLGSL